MSGTGTLVVILVIILEVIPVVTLDAIPVWGRGTVEILVLVVG